MKKVKIMLMSLAVVAIIGGALAFKVLNFYQNYCSISSQFDPNPPPGKPSYYCSDDPRWIGSKICDTLNNVTTEDRIDPAIRSTTNVCTTVVLGKICNQHQDCNTLTTVWEDNY